MMVHALVVAMDLSQPKPRNALGCAAVLWFWRWALGPPKKIVEARPGLVRTHSVAKPPMAHHLAAVFQLHPAAKVDPKCKW